MWKGWTVGLLGVLQFILGFLHMSTKAFMWDYIIIGLIVAIVGFWMISDNKKWQGWLSGIAGIWLFISAFIQSLLSHPGALWNSIIVGIVIAICGFAALSKNEQA